MANSSLLSNGGDEVEENEEECELRRTKSHHHRKYIPLCDVYSATTPCAATTPGSKKVKAAARGESLTIVDGGGDRMRRHRRILTVTRVYSRRRDMREEKRKEGAFIRSVVSAVEESEVEVEPSAKKRRIGRCAAELVKLGVDCEGLREVEGSDRRRVAGRKRGFGGLTACNDRPESSKRKNGSLKCDANKPEDLNKKKWVWLSYEGADQKKFVGLECKVYWPMDTTWYAGRISGYNSKTGRHQVKYEDGDEESLALSKQRIKFLISSAKIQHLELQCCDRRNEADGIDVDELMVLAASLDDCQEIEPGDIIWAKLTGHAVWPALILDESHVAERKGLNKCTGDNSVLVQFFGTHDFARVKRKQVIPFLKGLLSSCHIKCKKTTFVRGLEEAKLYLSEQRLPETMLQLQNGAEDVSNDMGSGERENGDDLGDADGLSHDDIRKKIDDLKSCPLEAGELQVISLGKIVRNSINLQNERFIYPEGYTAVRKFLSVTDPSVDALYKMEVLRDVDPKAGPLFRVTTDDGEEIQGPTPSACWNKIYQRIKTLQINNRHYKTEQTFESGSYMFGFSHPKVSRLIKEMSNSRSSSKPSGSASKKNKHVHGCYRAVQVEWRDLDKCNVCHMDEEYENNLFLQCEKCRMMVHARCYGVPENNEDALWLCNLCRPGAPESPPCCLCPVVGGAMKPTSDGRWAHLTCAIWIPETCLADIKKMEPIDGLHRINKDRWKLLCSICDVSYGACIQCSNNACRVAYHPLCARAAGFCLEPEDVDRPHLVPFDEDGEDQCIHLLSYCKKHRPSSSERSDERIEQKACELADYTPELNSSGSARTVLNDLSRRRGRNEPEALAAASRKRLYVENMPYVVGACSPNMPLWNKMSSSSVDRSRYSAELLKVQASQADKSRKIVSYADKHRHMKETFKQRLTFGKSRIHGYGIFAKVPHRAGDWVIEYVGEIIRARVADKRESEIYNKLVGAGTYMFRIDDDRVIDATRKGSIAHLINHSCDPNCYSRSIKINGEDHIIIFTKRDIKQWEEITYDYRFSSSDERLACHCGSARCRGFVNDPEGERKKLYVPASELVDWNGE